MARRFTGTDVAQVSAASLTTQAVSTWAWVRGPGASNARLIASSSISLFTLYWAESASELRFERFTSGTAGVWHVAQAEHGVNLANWTFVAVSYFGSGAPVIYIASADGPLLTPTVYVTLAPSGTPSTDASFNLWVGNNPAGTLPVGGDLAHVGYAAAALSAAEIREAMRYGRPLSGASVWLPLAGDSPEPDRSGAIRTAALTGSTIVADPPLSRRALLLGGGDATPVPAPPMQATHSGDHQILTAAGIIQPSSGTLAQGEHIGVALVVYSEPEPPDAVPDPFVLEPVGGPVGALLYEALAPLAEGDALAGYPLRSLAEAAGLGLDPLDALVRDTDDGPGWSALMDPDRIPAEGLPWLAQIVGVRLAEGASEETSRREVHNAAGQRRGSLRSLIAAVQETLTGARTVLVRERDGGRFALTVITYAAQTPDPAASEAAARAQKAAGLLLTYILQTGQDWQTLIGERPTWSAVSAAYPTWAAVVADTPA